MDKETVILLLIGGFFTYCIIYFISNYKKDIIVQGTYSNNIPNNYVLASTQIDEKTRAPTYNTNDDSKTAYAPKVIKSGHVNSIIQHDAHSWRQSLGNLHNFTITSNPFYGTPDKSCGAYVNLNSFIKSDGVILDKKILDAMIDNQCSDRDKTIEFSYTYT